MIQARNSKSGRSEPSLAFLLADALQQRKQVTRVKTVQAGVDFTERPWLRELIAAPAAAPMATRKRPLLYIYDLPAEFNSRMLQYRLNKVPVFRHLTCRALQHVVCAT